MPATPSSKPEAVQASVCPANGQLSPPPSHDRLVVDPGEQSARRCEIDRISIAPVALEEHVRRTGRPGQETGLVGRVLGSRAEAGAYRLRSTVAAGSTRTCVRSESWVAGAVGEASSTSTTPA